MTRVIGVEGAREFLSLKDLSNLFALAKLHGFIVKLFDVSD